MVSHLERMIPFSCAISTGKENAISFVDASRKQRKFKVQQVVSAFFQADRQTDRQTSRRAQVNSQPA